MAQPSKDKSLARSLGEFFGHIIKGVKTNSASDAEAQRRVVKHDVEEESRQTPEGQITLRRTTIEEVEIRKNS